MAAYMKKAEPAAASQRLLLLRRLHPRSNLRDLPRGQGIMNVPLLPLDLDAFIPDRHKGKQVADAGPDVPARRGSASAPGSSPDERNKGLVPPALVL